MKINVETIYSEVVENHMMLDEPFTNDDREDRMNEWIEEHLDPNSQDDAIMVLLNLICEYQKGAFMAGYEAARNLIVG